MRIPKSIKDEHAEIHNGLVAASRAGGRTGEAARLVAQAVYPHFVREEEYALPQLGILADFAEGRLPADSAAIIAKSDRLKAEYPGMLNDHKTIIAALHGLTEAARNEKKNEFVQLAEKLHQHAVAEEEVLYPASLLIGEFLKLKTGRG